MANVKILRWRPDTTYIPLAPVGVLRLGFANFMFRVGGNAFGVLPNVNPKREGFCVTVEYRLKHSLSGVGSDNTICVWYT